MVAEVMEVVVSVAGSKVGYVAVEEADMERPPAELVAAQVADQMAVGHSAGVSVAEVEMEVVGAEAATKAEGEAGRVNAAG